MSTPPGPGVPPGWYADPSGQAAWRWWNGTQWTEHASSPAGPPPVPPGTPGAYRSYNSAELNTPFDPRVHPVFSGQQKIATWSSRAFHASPLVAMIGIAQSWAFGAGTRNYLHSVQAQSQTGIIGSSSSTPVAYTLLAPGVLATFVFVWIALGLWQYRCARTAVLLRLPATWSPAMGVGAWFIPVVNLWFPYQAVRDLLPPGDPQRALVLQWWLSWVGLGTASALTSMLAFAGSSAAIVLTIITLVLAIGFGVLGARLVDVVRTTHLRLIVGPQADL